MKCIKDDEVKCPSRYMSSLQWNGEKERKMKHSPHTRKAKRKRKASRPIILNQKFNKLFHLIYCFCFERYVFVIFLFCVRLLFAFFPSFQYFSLNKAIQLWTKMEHKLEIGIFWTWPRSVWGSVRMKEAPNGYTMQSVCVCVCNTMKRTAYKLMFFMSKNLLSELSLVRTCLSRKQIFNIQLPFYPHPYQRTNGMLSSSVCVHRIHFSSFHTQTLTYWHTHNLWYLFFFFAADFLRYYSFLFFFKCFSFNISLRDFFYSILMIYATLTAQTYAFQLDCYWFIVTCTQTVRTNSRISEVL